jgi:DNA-binding beta-propeller fold protein YncE
VNTPHYPGPTRSLGPIGLLLLVCAHGCGSERLVVVPPDTSAPHLQVIAPLDTLYDLDGDKLVDVRLTWSDAGRVNPASARLRTLRSLSGSADTTTNLLDVWRVTQRDSAGLWVHETLANLLPDEANALEVSVADTAGNRFTDTLRFTLPHGAYYTTMETGVSSAYWALDIAFDSAGRRGYMTAGQTLVVFDPESLRVVARIVSGASNTLSDIALDAARGFLYVGEGYVEKYDLRTNTFVERVPGTYATTGLAFSRADSRLLYAGEDFAGYLGYVDVVADQHVDEMIIPHPYAPDEFISELAVLAGDSKLYMTRYNQCGILVVDPRTKQVLRHVQTAGLTPFCSGDFVLSRDDRHLYVALTDASPRGVGDLDTSTDSIVRTMDFPAYVPNGIGLSPSQHRLFLTTGQAYPDIPPKDFLFDVRHYGVLESFDVPGAPSTIRLDGPVAFRPDGKLIFVGRNLDIAVYLNRESGL